jgi:hypothetical protein
MFLQLLRKLESAVVKMKIGKVHKIMAQVYPDMEDRASAYLAEGASVTSLVMFNAGAPWDSIEIVPDDDGYLIHVGEDE